MQFIKCKGYIKIDLKNTYIQGTNINIIIRDCQLDQLIMEGFPDDNVKINLEIHNSTIGVVYS